MLALVWRVCAEQKWEKWKNVKTHQLRCICHTLSSPDQQSSTTCFLPFWMCPKHIPLYLGPTRSRDGSIPSNLFNVCPINDSERKGKVRDNFESKRKYWVIYITSWERCPQHRWISLEMTKWIKMVVVKRTAIQRAVIQGGTIQKSTDEFRIRCIFL